MKDIVIHNNKGQLFKQKILTFVLVAFLIYLVINSAITCIPMLNSDTYFKNVHGTIESETVATVSSSYLSIKLEGDENEYLILYTEEEFQKVASVGDEITIRYASTTSSGTTYNVAYYASVGDTVLIDQVQTLADSARSTIVFCAIGLVAAIVFLIVTIVNILKKPLTEKYEYAQYALGQPGNVTSRMIDKKTKTSKSLTMYNVLCIVFAGLLLGVLLIKDSLSSWFGDQVLIFYIVFAVVMVVYLLLLLFVLLPKNHSKTADQYAQDYLSYIKNGPTFDRYALPYEFKDGMLYYHAKEEKQYPIESLNLYAVAAYRKYFTAGNIFIATDRADLAENEVDFILPLTDKIYEQLQENNISVKGLDFLMNNFASEIKKNAPLCKKDNIVVKYKEEE